MDPETALMVILTKWVLQCRAIHVSYTPQNFLHALSLFIHTKETLESMSSAGSVW